MFRFISLIVKVALIMVNLWFFASFIDVVIHNTGAHGATVLMAWNFFKVVM